MRNLLFFCSFFSCTLLRAQSPSDFAESFFFFPKNTFLLIPSYAGIDSDAQANLAYRSYFGQMSVLRTYLADFNYNLQKKNKLFPEHDKHMLGAGFYNEREGDFFNHNRVMLRYAWHTRLTEKLNFSGGTAFHVINYIFKSSSAGSNGSAFSWSGNLSAAIYTSLFRLGVSVNDFNNPAVRPVDYTFVLYRYYTFHVEKAVHLSPQSLLTGSLRVNLVPQGTSTGMCNVGVLFADKVGLHAFAHTTQGWGLAIDFNHLEINDSWLDMSFAYKAPSPFGNRPPYSSYEINMGYYLSRSHSSIQK
jgi:hypothetical protein